MPETKDLHNFKNKFRLNFYARENFSTKVMTMLGMIGNKDRLTFKYQLVNEIESSIFSHDSSHYTQALQRSRYVMIDDDVERLQAHFDKTTENLKKELARLQVINVGGTADM